MSDHVSNMGVSLSTRTTTCVRHEDVGPELTREEAVSATFLLDGQNGNCLSLVKRFLSSEAAVSSFMLVDAPCALADVCSLELQVAHVYCRTSANGRGGMLCAHEPSARRKHGAAVCHRACVRLRDVQCGESQLPPAAEVTSDISILGVGNEHPRSGRYDARMLTAVSWEFQRGPLANELVTAVSLTAVSPHVPGSVVDAD